MKKCLLFIILVLNTIATAEISDIIALVNSNPITLYEFQARKKLFMVLNNIQNVDAAVEKQLNNSAINSLIDEQILFDHSQKVGGKVSEAEIAGAIKTIEAKNKMPTGYLLTYLKSNGVDVNSFHAQIKSEIIKMNILGYISKSITVSPKEIDAAILAVGSKDAHIVAEIYTSKDKKDKTLSKMHYLQQKIKGCGSVKEAHYKNFANIVMINNNLSELSNHIQSTLKDLSVNQSSGVYEAAEGFKIVVLCEKKIHNISIEENNYVTNLLSNKKMSQKAVKFFQDLRKKAYIKILIQ